MRRMFHDPVVFDYILDSIEGEGYDRELNSDKEKVEFVMECFNGEYNTMYEKRLYPNLEQRFTEWVKGLPTTFNVAFQNYEILELAKKWGSLPENATEALEDKILSNWFPWITGKFFKLAKKLKIDYSHLR